MISPRTSFLRARAVALALGLGGLAACFDGFEAFGLPCTEDWHCGTLMLCESNYCGGEVLCGDGNLVPVTMACDGTPDCNDAIDEKPERCGGDPLGGQLCAAIDSLNQTCEDEFGVEAEDCMAYAAADDLCESNQLGDPCVAVLPLDALCEQRFGENASQCDGLDAVEEACG